MILNRRRNLYTALLIALASVIVMSIMGKICLNNISQGMLLQARQNLAKVSERNAILIENEINDKIVVLRGMAAHIPARPISVSNVVEGLRDAKDIYDFDNVGYVDIAGNVLTTNGQSFNVKNEQFFNLAISGESSITRLERTSLGVENPENVIDYVNVLSVPIWGEQGVVAVLFATYSADWLGSVLENDDIAGNYSFITNKAGLIVAHSANSPMSDINNFFVFLEEKTNLEDEAAINIVSQIENGQNGVGSFVNGEKQDFCFEGLKYSILKDDWYIVTVVPDMAISGTLNDISDRVERLIVGMVLIGVLCVVLFLWIYSDRNEKLKKMAYEDTLTGGDNIACFKEKIKRCRYDEAYFVAMDLAEFKIINNTCGTTIGDTVLKRVYEILNKNMDAKELYTRIYADRFLMLFACKEKEELISRIERIYDEIVTMSELMKIPRVVPVFGIYHTDDLVDVDNNYGHAVRAKKLVKGRRDRYYAFFEELDQSQVLENKEIEDNFDEDVRAKRFEVWYQPKYSAKTGDIVGAEALVRLRKANGDLVPPYKFIPLFEKNGTIPELDEYVFRAVCNQQKKWLEQGIEVLPVSVNISRVSLYYSNITDKYKAIPASISLSPEYVQLEITESAASDNKDLAVLIDGFQKAGFRVLLDDFGTGFSSLSTLNVLHFDTMKLDKSLIDYIGDENGEKLLNYIAKMGQNLGLHITAEGVETQSQVDFLKQLECDDIQGYFFSKPIPLDEYEKLLSSRMVG